MDSKKIDTDVGVGLAVLSAVIYFYAGQYSSLGVNRYGPNFFPQVLSILLFICSGSLAFKAMKGEVEGELEAFNRSGVVNVGITLTIAILYLFALQILGFFISSILFLYFIMLALGKKQQLLMLLTSVGVASVVWLIFANFLMIPMPEGIFSK